MLRQYLTKGTNWSGYTRRESSTIAHCLNIRPRHCLNWAIPLELFVRLHHLHSLYVELETALRMPVCTLDMVNLCLARIIHDGSPLSCGVATRDGCAEPWGREASLTKMSTDRAESPHGAELVAAANS